MNTNIKLLVESIFDDNEDIFNPEKEYLDDMSDIISEYTYLYRPQNEKELVNIINNIIDEYDYQKENGVLYLNNIDVRNLSPQDFELLFYQNDFIQTNVKCPIPESKHIHTIDISRWLITTISEYMFCNCKSIHNVILPKNYNKIEFAAFFKSGIDSITIPYTVTEIGSQAFEGCEELHKIKFTGDISAIKFGDNVFKNCRNIYHLYLQNPDDYKNVQFDSPESDPLYYNGNYVNIHTLNESIFDENKDLFDLDYNFGFDYLFDINDHLLNEIINCQQMLPPRLQTKNMNLNLYTILKNAGRWDKIDKTITIDDCNIGLIREPGTNKFTNDKMFNLYKNIFNRFKQYDIHIHIKYLNISLENSDKNLLYKISDYIDFSEYSDILTCDQVSVMFTQLEDLSGLPENINRALCFLYISKINTFNGFPNTANPVILHFYKSSLPLDWTGCPDKLKEIQLNIFDDCMKDNDPQIVLPVAMAVISKFIHEFKNIPETLQLEIPGIIPEWLNVTTKKLLRQHLREYLPKQIYKIFKVMRRI